MTLKSMSGQDGPPIPGNLPLSKDSVVLLVFTLLSILAYFWNLGLNNIWTPNEAFYAEAAREMINNGNFLDIYYNYELRFNKPPMLYWLIAISGSIFGLSEWAVRLPSALAGLGSVWLVFLIGKYLGSRKLGIVAALVMVFSFQFVINARYASPAVLLTFFYTLTLYFFLRGYHEEKEKYIWQTWISLGLTVLTKGFPYIIVIGGIAGLYVLLDKKLDWRSWLRTIWGFKLIPGLLLALLIGLSWPVYSYFKFQDQFYEVLMDETFRRALTGSSSLKPFFYLEANSWGFLPYSLSFYLGLVYLIAHRFKNVLNQRVLIFGLSWFVVMLVIFTVSRGKIPTYFIQGHPGMSLVTAFFIVGFTGAVNIWSKVFRWTFILPGVVLTLGGYAIIYLLQASPAYYMIAFLPIGALVLGYWKDIEYLKVPYFPFYSFLIMYLLFSAIVLPYMDDGYREQDEMGLEIREAVPDGNVPVLIEEVNLHNLPFYAHRKIYPYQTAEQIMEFGEDREMLVFTPATHSGDYGEGGTTVWEGPYYDGSETRTLEFILNVMKAREGEDTNFETYRIIYFPKGEGK